ncbi:glutathione S-transferase family protein [Burkholderiales bacterium]|nr:glutathione S-transferase family protein [Burkholderiales bacterium]
MALEIIGTPISNFVRAVRMVAEEKGVVYKNTPEMPHSDAMKSLHPLGQVPVMRHDGFHLFESMAIARYIDNVFDGPALVPASPEAAAKTVQWISFAQTSVDQLIVRQYCLEYLFNKDEHGNVIRDNIEKVLNKVSKMFLVLDEAVSSGYFGSDEFSMADCFLMPIIYYGQMFPEGKAALESAKNLKVYYEKLSQRPSFISTTA